MTALRRHIAKPTVRTRVSRMTVPRGARTAMVLLELLSANAAYAESGFAEPVTQSLQLPQTSTTSSVEPVNHEQWYGLPIVVADSTAVLLLAGLALGSPIDMVAGGTSVLLYTAGGPVVHLLAGQNTNAAASLGLRLLPVAVGGGLIFANINDRDMRWISVGASV